MRCLLKVLEAVYPKIHAAKEDRVLALRRRSRTISDGCVPTDKQPHASTSKHVHSETKPNGHKSDETQHDSQDEAENFNEILTRMLYEILQVFAADIVKYLPMVSMTLRLLFEFSDVSQSIHKDGF